MMRLRVSPTCARSSEPGRLSPRVSRTCVLSPSSSDATDDFAGAARARRGEAGAVARQVCAKGLRPRTRAGRASARETAPRGRRAQHRQFRVLPWALADRRDRLDSAARSSNSRPSSRRPSARRSSCDAPTRCSSASSTRSRRATRASPSSSSSARRGLADTSRRASRRGPSRRPSLAPPELPVSPRPPHICETTLTPEQLLRPRPHNRRGGGSNRITERRAFASLLDLLYPFPPTLSSCTPFPSLRSLNTCRNGHSLFLFASLGRGPSPSNTQETFEA